MKKPSCPKCQIDQNVLAVEQEMKITLHKKEILFKAKLYRCLMCGSEFETFKQLKHNLWTAKKAAKRMYQNG